MTSAGIAGFIIAMIGVSILPPDPTWKTDIGLFLTIFGAGLFWWECGCHFK